MAQSFGGRAYQPAVVSGCFTIKTNQMSNRNKNEQDRLSGNTNTPRHKGEEHNNPQKGAQGVSNKKGEKHRKDESEGADRNTTKRGENSI